MENLKNQQFPNGTLANGGKTKIQPLFFRTAFWRLEETVSKKKLLMWIFQVVSREN
jgi:hypothetical protein